MASCMVQTAGSDRLATQIQIGPVVSLIGRALQDVASAWGTAVIAWRSRKQTRMVFITTQVEHVRDRMEKGVVEVPVQVADVLTKPLSRIKFG